MRCTITGKSCLCALLGLCMLAGCGAKQVAGDDPPRVTPAVNTHFVTLNWEPSKSKVAGYNVYRALKNEAPVKLTNEIVPGTEYTDTNVEASRAYVYYVASVDPAGRQGILSKGVEVKVPETTSKGASASR
jgi:fibronectin type 3 domain-containing protein